MLKAKQSDSSDPCGRFKSRLDKMSPNAAVAVTLNLITHLVQRGGGGDRALQPEFFLQLGNHQRHLAPPQPLQGVVDLLLHRKVT